MATIFKKIKFNTHENIGSGPIHLPELNIFTVAAWISLNEELKENEQDDLEEGLIGAAHALKQLFRCSPCVIRGYSCVPQVKSAHNRKTDYIHIRSLSRWGWFKVRNLVYELMTEILSEAKKIVSHCPCKSGCPSCIGTDTSMNRAKELTIDLLEKMFAASASGE